MKKIILLFTIVAIFVSCSNKITAKESLISIAEQELKKSMNDPSSYEFVSFLEDLKKSTDSQQEDGYSLRYYKLNFRGKNAMGALVLNDVYVISDDELKFLEIQNIED